MANFVCFAGRDHLLHLDVARIESIDLNGPRDTIGSTGLIEVTMQSGQTHTVRTSETDKLLQFAGLVT